MPDLRKHLLNATFLVAFLFPLQPSAGPLEDFEADVKTHSEKASKAVANKAHSDDASDDFGFLDSFIDASFDVFFDTLFEGMDQVFSENTDSVREYVDGSGYQDARKQGDALFSFIRLNANRIDVSNAISGDDLRLELGNGELATSIQFTEYRDDALLEELSNLSIQFHYRFLLGDRLSFSPGVGYARLQGVSDYDGGAVSLAMLYKFNNLLALEYRPMWQDASGADVAQHDTALLISKRKLAVRLGYRRFSSANEDIQGPYIGLEFIY